MLFTKLFTIASMAAVAVAQGRIAFTSTPSSVKAGVPVTITWSGGSSDPVTITLKKGDATDLKTVAVLTGGAAGQSFTWTPSKDLENGDNYALSISQGTGVMSTNYSGLISLSGGSAAGATASGTATLVTTGSASTGTTTLSGVKTTTHSMTSTPVLTAASSAGTGTTMSRNSTFSSATLGSSTAAATLTSTRGASSTGSAVSTATTGAAVGLQVQGALGAGAFAAALFFL